MIASFFGVLGPRAPKRSWVHRGPIHRELLWQLMRCRQYQDSEEGLLVGLTKIGSGTRVTLSDGSLCAVFELEEDIPCATRLLCKGE